MTQSLSADLRGRVIAAIEDGLSTREAARRFRVGISTASNWYRRYRQAGERTARKLGHAWMTQTLERIANRWPNSRIDELMPWNFSP
jgi:transposase